MESNNQEKLSDMFLSMTDSLSKYRRAELKDDDGKNLIEKLYVDPLENNLILKSMLKNNTTLLIGRKGTGKSTIINRFQHEIRKTNNKLSLYIDVKALFEQTKKSYFNLQSLDIELSKKNLDRLSLYVFFIKKIIDELKKEIKSSIFQADFKSIFLKKGITKKAFNKKLDDLFEAIKKPLFIDVTSSHQANLSVHDKIVTENSNKVELQASVPKQSVNGGINNSLMNEEMESKQFTKVLTRFFDIIGFMNNLKKLLKQIPIDNVFICLDDMSEIDKKSMEVFTDFIVGPLNNLSDEYFKFKISLYPGRDFLPSIDRQKVKTYALDYYDLYSAGNVDKVEESAIKYTRRLVEKRFDYYFKEVEMSKFFEINSSTSMRDYYKMLFQASSNVPRIIGKFLEISLQKTNSLEQKITKRILQESTKQHYKNDVEFVLTKSEYIEYKSYNESFEKYHLLELLNILIDKAIKNKKHIGASNAKIFEQYTTNTAPSNYLYIPEGLEEVLKTLEFNFFITKYSQQKDKDGANISVFSLNYGLCIDNNIIFDEKSDRKFRIERTFDFNKIFTDWMKNSQELVCLTCNELYDISKKEVFIEHKIPCQKCKCEVVLRPIINSKQKEIIKNNVKIPSKEYEILNALNNKTYMTATELGDELDRAYQSINHSIGMNSKINNFEFIERKKVNNKPYFSLSLNGRLFLNGDFKKP
jgi:energy-coupling factor transporter ATP-binding protein EcfA2